jgi:hypothetical protein
VAALGLWLSRDYQIGTALRMGTGYVPRLLCWSLLALGIVILLRGLRGPVAAPIGEGIAWAWRPAFFVTGALTAFALSLERLGLVLSIFVLVLLGACATRLLRPLETIIAAVALIAFSYLVFIVGLGLTLPVWPKW